MGRGLGKWTGPAVLLLLGAGSGCAGFPWSGGGKEAFLEAALSPLQGAWTAATVLAGEVPRPARGETVPLVRTGRSSYLLEARARPGRLYRFRRGWTFLPLDPTPPFSVGKDPDPAKLLETLEPQPFPLASFRPTGSAPFPSFYDSYLKVQVEGAGRRGCRIRIQWKDRPGTPLGERVLAHLRRALAILEPLEEGNRRFLAGDPAGALESYDRALAAGRPPCCAFHARCLARIHFNRGVCLARLGDLDGALLALERSKALDPHLPGADLLAGSLGSLLGKKPGETPSNGGLPGKEADLLGKGNHLLSRGRARQAERVFLVARTRKGLSVAALQGLSRAEEMLGRKWRARAHLLQALERSPGNPAVLAELARLSEDQGDPFQALEAARLLGTGSQAFREILARVPPGTAAPFLALVCRRPAPLPDSPMKRALAAARTGSPLFLSVLPGPGKALPAEPVR